MQTSRPGASAGAYHEGMIRKLARLIVALALLIFGPRFAVPAHADSDGYYCVGPNYLAYQFGFAAPSPTPHRLFVVWLGTAEVIERVAFDLPAFQVHGMTCDKDRIRVAAYDRLYTVALNDRARPLSISETPYERPGAFPFEVSSLQRNLGGWSRPVNTLQSERVPLPAAAGTKVVLEIAPRPGDERCVTLITTRVLVTDSSGQAVRALTVFQGQGHRTCGEGPTDAELAQSLEQVVARAVAADEFSGVVLLSRYGKPLFRRAYGFADREKARANTVETPFALASVSKMFTAVVVAALAERKMISFNASIGSLLPAYPKGEASAKVTVHHLLTMSSGIPDLFRSPQFWADVAKVKAFADFWPHFAHAPLDFEPGARGAYSNSNFLVLGAIIERVLGRPFIESVEREVFRAAGMTRTGYLTSAFPGAALGYTRRRGGGGSAPSGESGQWQRAWDDPFAERGRSAAAAEADCLPCAPMGGGYSTADDLARFADALMAGRLLGADMTRRVLTGYVAATEYAGQDGYGFETRLVGGVRIAGHRGGFSGINNRVEFYPDLGYVLVVLGNTDANGAEAIADHVRKRTSLGR